MDGWRDQCMDGQKDRTSYRDGQTDPHYRKKNVKHAAFAQQKTHRLAIFNLHKTESN